MAKLAVMLYGRRNDELEAFVKTNLDTQAELIVCGVLDGLSDEQVMAIAAKTPEAGVPEYLADGRVVFVDHDEIANRAKLLAAELLKKGIARSLICCTSPWPSLESEAHIIVPVKILVHVALSLLPTGGTLGLMQPVDETKNEEIKHWQALGVNLVSTVVSPESCTDEELVQAAEHLLAQGVDVIAMDCMSFTQHHRALALQRTAKPCLLPMTLVGKVINEVFGLA